MRYQDIVRRYGKDTAFLIMNNRYMDGMTFRMIRVSDGCPATFLDYNSGDIEPDYFEDDIERAYRDIIGVPIYPSDGD